MLVDGHCTGGYPRALQVIRADFWLQGQIAPGSQVSFRRCFEDNAPKILAGRNSFYGGEYGGLIDGFAF
jgi:allophanate hydrolase subunit 2